jgi:chorismate synthase
LPGSCCGTSTWRIVSHVYQVNGIGIESPLRVTFEAARDVGPDSALHCADLDAEVKMIAEIDRCRDAGDTAGGAFEVIARGLPVGLGSYVHWDRKLDGRLAQAMMSIPAIKAVGIGIGPKAAAVPGSQMHDEIVPAPSRTKPPIGVIRPTNNAGGLEGGVTNGEDLRISGFMKPIATLMTPLRSVDLAGMTRHPP